MGLSWSDYNSDPLADLRAFKAQCYNEPWRPLHVIFKGALIEGFDMSTDVYVAIYPYSNTNPTNKYRVVRNSEWVKVLDGEQTKYRFTEYDTIGEALDARDKLNGVTKAAVSVENSEDEDK